MFPNALIEQARRVAETCIRRRLRIATAESCTGGLIAGCLTEAPGVSEVFVTGFVTYANEAKTDELGVDEALIRDHGAVSPEVARAMAEGALERAQADVSVSSTGIAGPSGGTAEKPVGLVQLAAARRGAETLHERHLFAGDRTAVRLAAVGAALALLERAAKT
jgi:nicotinamide-nucleotide amidase